MNNERIDPRVIAQGLAREMVGWNYVPNEGYEHYCYLRHDQTGARCSVAWYSVDPKRIVIKGVYPDHVNGHKGSAWSWGLAWDKSTYRDPSEKKEPSITVGVARPALDQALEFKRRFEGWFLETWHIAVQKHTADLLAFEAGSKVLEQLFEVAGDGRRTTKHEHSGVIHGPEWRADVHVHVNREREIAVTLEVSVDAETAVAVMALVAARMGKRAVQTFEDETVAEVPAGRVRTGEGDDDEQ